MLELKVYNNNARLVDADEKELGSVPMLDLYYMIGTMSEEPSLSSLSTIDKMKVIATEINKEYGIELSWGQVMDLLVDLEKEITALKKNSTSTVK